MQARPAASSAVGSVLVLTISRTSGCAAIRFSAPSLNSPCVQAIRTDRTSRSPQPVQQFQ